MYGEFQISLSYLARQTGPTDWEKYIYLLYMSYPSMQAKACLILAPVQFVYFTIYLLHICNHIFIAFMCLCVLCICLSSLVRERLSEVGSILPQCGYRAGTQVVRLNSGSDLCRCLYQLGHLASPPSPTGWRSVCFCFCFFVE